MAKSLLHVLGRIVFGGFAYKLTFYQINFTFPSNKFCVSTFFKLACIIHKANTAMR